MFQQIPLLISLSLSLWVFALLSSCQEAAKDEPVYYTVQSGNLPVYVSATGELAAKRSTKIRGPQGMRAAGVYETTLSDIVAEGTVVKKGEYVAKLDRTEVANKLTNLRTELEKIQTQLEQAQIDTAIELRGLRDQLINNRFTLREKELQTQLNVYEAEAIKRQTQLELEKAERDFQQLQQNFTLKQEQAEAKIREIEAQRQQQLRELNILQELSADFTIHAPEDGMVIYARGWRGKVEPGSRITAWDPVVAELPDLNDMISKIYVNEVDISKVRKGQAVEVTLDAFAGLSYRGEVSSIANIGEQVRGYDAKVFEVEVQMMDLDSIMRPAMTTGNQILVNQHEDVLAIPLEALRTDTLSYVYLRKGRELVRQQVETGALGTDKIIITAGLSPNAEILLSLPPEGADYPWQSLNPQQSMANE